MAKDSEGSSAGGASRDLDRTMRLVGLAVLVAIMAALVIDNRRDVTIGWVVGDTTAPLALALTIAFVLGLGVGWLGARHRRS